MVVFPNPASSQLNIIFAAKNAENLTISLINSAGQKINNSQQAIPAGNFSTITDVSKLPPGTYVLKIQLGQKAYNTKVIVLR